MSADIIRAPFFKLFFDNFTNVDVIQFIYL
nr:MAG TPA: hypothetical protein [Caudoviricetes sp.]